MWLLDTSGRLHEGTVDGPSLDAADPLPPALPDGPVAIRFGGTQDGRGFSRARQLRARGHVGRLVALGPLEPDQARHALQSGFDAVAIEDATLARHGRAAWERALTTSVTTPYHGDPTDRLGQPGIWALRHAADRPAHRKAPLS